MKPPQAFRKLIERSGLSLEKIAQGAGYSFASGLQRYVSDDYAKPFFPRELVDKLRKPLVGRGDPPITAEELLALAGVVMASKEKPPSSGMVEVIALDVNAAMGGGSIVESEEEVGKFGFPPGEFNVPADRLRIITVTGDSMFDPKDPSSLQSGDRVVIDTGQRVPSQGGIYALFNGTGTVVKRVEMLLKSKKVRVFSINPAYSDDVLSANEVHIQGRVVGCWRRM